ncbi:MAG: 2-dehydropantoate 2-reductase N-terminal domain-containing protein [Oscillospiraceae bacterium]
MENAVIVGAGKTGRGFIARLLQEAGIPFSLQDTDEALLQKIEKSNGFTIRFFSGRGPVAIPPVPLAASGSPAAQSALQKAAYIFVSVGAKNLPAAARQLGAALAGFGGKPRTIFLCENAVAPAPEFRRIFREAGGPEDTGICEAAVFCTTIETEPGAVNIASEAFPHLIYSTQGVAAPLPAAPQFAPEENFPVLLKRKIYTYNASSAIICYLGWALGLSSFGQSAHVPVVKKILDSFYQSINQAICREYGTSPKEQEAFSQMAWEKFSDLAIADTNQRNCAQPERKLAATERIAVPIRLLLKHRLPLAGMCLTAAAAIRYGEAYTENWKDLFPGMTAGETFARLAEIDSAPVCAAVQTAYDALLPPISEANLEALYQTVGAQPAL